MNIVKILDFAYTSEYMSKISSSLDNSPHEIAEKYGYKILSETVDITSNYKGLAFESKENKEIIISHSTHDLKAVEAFFANPTIKNFNKAYFDLRPEFVKNSKTSIAYLKSLSIATSFVGNLISNKPDYKIIQVGHSCGGKLAQHIYSVYDVETYCIESPGAKGDLLKDNYENINFHIHPQTDISMSNGKLVTVRKNPIHYYFNEPNLINSFGERFFFDSKIHVITSKTKVINPIKYNLFNKSDKSFDFSFIKFIMRSTYEHLIETIFIKLDKDEVEIIETYESNWPKNYIEAYSYFRSKKNKKYWYKKFDILADEELPNELMNYRQEILNFFMFKYIRAPEKLNYKKIISFKDLSFKTLIEDFIYQKYVNNCVDFLKYQAVKFKSHFYGDDFFKILKDKSNNTKTTALELENQNSKIQKTFIAKNTIQENNHLNKIINNEDTLQVSNKAINANFRGSMSSSLSNLMIKDRILSINENLSKSAQGNSDATAQEIKVNKINSNISFNELHNNNFRNVFNDEKISPPISEQNISQLSPIPSNNENCDSSVSQSNYIYDRKNYQHNPEIHNLQNHKDSIFKKGKTSVKSLEINEQKHIPTLHPESIKDKEDFDEHWHRMLKSNQPQSNLQYPQNKIGFAFEEKLDHKDLTGNSDDFFKE